MLFHVGSLWRLHELGLLKEATQISSVSGGSITAGVLALQWSRIQRDLATPMDAGGRHDSSCYRQLVAAPLMNLASETIDVSAVLGGGGSRLESIYSEKLFGNASLMSTPNVPVFRLNATNLQTGAVFSFFKDAINDPSIGSKASTGNIRIAAAVAASSAFPPYLSPVVLSFDVQGWTNPGVPGGEMVERKGSRIAPNRYDEYRRKVMLVDGGVADNLGLEPIWHEDGRFLISDGGGLTKADPNPPTDWLGQVSRVMGLIHDQPSGLRAKAFNNARRAEPWSQPRPDREMAASANPDRGKGAYWSIAQAPVTQENDCPSPASIEEVSRLAQIDTRLQRLSERDTKRLINWGYHSADYSLPYLESVRTREPKYRPSLRLPFPEESIFVAVQIATTCDFAN